MMCLRDGNIPAELARDWKQWWNFGHGVAHSTTWTGEFFPLGYVPFGQAIVHGVMMVVMFLYVDKTFI